MKAISAIKDLVTSKAGIQMLKAQKHAPVILFAAGVTGVVGTVVLACRATLKLDEVLEESEKQINRVNLNYGIAPNYTEEMLKRDKAVIVIKTATKIAKMYAPAVVVGVAAIAALTGSHVILTKRYLSTSAALAGAAKALDAYRAKVIDTYGIDKDVEFMYGTEDVEIEEVGKDGEVKTKKGKKVGTDSLSQYAVLFDEVNSSEWSKEPNYNQMFIAAQQQYANDRLRTRGYVFLSDVLEGLGLPVTKASRVVGWVAGHGDDYIDFGIFKGRLEPKTRFVNGDEKSVWLDFNVMGNILEIFEEMQ